jgi:transposase
VGSRIPKGCSAASFHKKATAHIPAPVLPALRPAMETLAALATRIRELDKQIERLCEERHPETRLLRQVNGVGPITALTYVLTIGDPHRFERSREVAAFLGLVPRRDKSGMHDPELRITKAGDEDLRRLLVQCAHYILGPFGADSDLRRWGLGLASRGKKNAKKRAAVAVARKLSVLLHRLWISAEAYDPLMNSKREAANAV